MNRSFNNQNLRKKKISKYFSSLKEEGKFKELAEIIIEDFAPETVLEYDEAGNFLAKELEDLSVKCSSVCCLEDLAKEEKSFIKKKYDILIYFNNEPYIGFVDFVDVVSKFEKICFNVLFIDGSLKKDREKLNRVSSLFAKNKMLRNIEYLKEWDCYEIYLFNRFDAENFYEIVGEYENCFSNYKDLVEKLKKENLILNNKVEFYSKRLINLKKIRNKCYKLEKYAHEMNLQNRALRVAEKSYVAIKNSTSWRITFPVRLFISFLRFIFKKFRKLMFIILKNMQPKNIKRNIIFFLRFGVRAALKQIFTKDKVFDTIVSFRKYFKLVMPTKKEIDFQKGYRFAKNMTFSIVVPLYNTPLNFLKQMIESVKGQSYPHWQLCLADGSDEGFSYVKECCKAYVSSDSRILYKKIGKNLGIAENTNAALDMATGDYIALFDHDDLLSPTALFEYMKVIEEIGADFIYSDEMTFENDNINEVTFIHCKQDYAPDTLLSCNYICHFSVFSAKLREKVGYFLNEYNGSQDYDYILRLTEKAKKIYHIPKILYYWRSSENSAAKDVRVKPYFFVAGKRAILAHLGRIGLEAQVEEGLHYSLYRVKYKIKDNPKISIIIPNKDHSLDLKNCVDSILDRSSYENFEILIVENGSSFETLDFYKVLQKQDKRIKVITYDGGFNYSLINNFAVNFAKGEHYLFLNNDTEVISKDWIQEMLMYSQRDDVGAVGAKLYYKDDTIQHAGVFLKIGGVAGHGHKGIPRNNLGYAGRAAIVQNVSAVTAACMMVSKKAFNSVNGFDKEFRVSFNDVDFCLRLRESGYLNVFTPYAEVYHYESKSRGYSDSDPKSYATMTYESELMYKRWAKYYKGKKEDPYYNPNLTLLDERFNMRFEDKI